MLKIATLGPSGTNHEMVTHRYMEFLGIENYSLLLVKAFHEAVEKLKSGIIDAIVQCAVHPATPETLGGNFNEIFVTDCFIADSQELGILTRKDVTDPKVLGILLPSCRNYTDISRWEKHENIHTLPVILDMLLEGKIDSGLVYTSYAKKHDDVLRLDEVIGSPDDVWIVYTRKRVSSKGGIVACKDSAGAEKLRRMAQA